MDRVETDVKKIVEMGFLRRLRGSEDRFEVRRMLKSFVDAQWLAEFEKRLSEYKAPRIRRWFRRGGGRDCTPELRLTA